MDDTVKVFQRVFSIAGISVYSKQHWESTEWLILQLSNFFAGILSFLFQSCFILFKVSNLLLFIQAACIWTTGAIVVIMLGIFLFYKTDIQHLLEQSFFNDLILEIPLIQNVFNFKYEQSKLKGLKELVLDSQRNLYKCTRILLKSYVACISSCVTIYVGGTIYAMYTAEDKSLRLIAFDMWFPWGLKNFKVYIASFIFNMHAGYMCSIVYPGVEITIVYLVMQTVRQLRILTYILQHLDVLAMELVEERKDKWQLVCTDLLTQCIIHYVKIKRFSTKLNLIYRPFYLALILFGVILFCMCSVKIAISDKLAFDTVKYYIHLCCYTFMVFMFCFAGQLVINECNKLDTILTDKWYIYDANHKRHIQIFKMALNQNMPIYIFGSITLSLPTFSWFIRTGMSVFTLIMSFLDD